VEISSQQFASILPSAFNVNQSKAVPDVPEAGASFDIVKSEIFESMKVFEVLDGKAATSLEISGGISDYRETSLALARFRADLYKIETVATAAQNVIGTFKNFISTFTK
jgi:hypothetical protein